MFLFHVCINNWIQNFVSPIFLTHLNNYWTSEKAFTSGFASVSLISLCTFRLCFHMSLLWQNPFPHTSHWYGFSPVWMRICVVSWFFFLKDLSQWVQRWGRTDEWVFLCCHSCFLYSPQMRQNPSALYWYVWANPMWTQRMCSRRLCLLFKTLEQSSHWNSKGVFLSSLSFLYSGWIFFMWLDR